MLAEKSMQRDFNRCDDALERSDSQRVVQCSIDASLRGMRVLHMATLVADSALDPSFAFRVHDALRQFREGWLRPNFMK